MVEIEIFNMYNNPHVYHTLRELSLRYEFLLRFVTTGTRNSTSISGWAKDTASAQDPAHQTLNITFM